MPETSAARSSRRQTTRRRARSSTAWATPYIEGAPVLVEMRDGPGGLADAAERLADAGVNVCGTLMVGRRPGVVEMIFCVDDEAKAHAALHQTPVEEVGVAD